MNEQGIVEDALGFLLAGQRHLSPWFPRRDRSGCRLEGARLLSRSLCRLESGAGKGWQSGRKDWAVLACCIIYISLLFSMAHINI